MKSYLNEYIFTVLSLFNAFLFKQLAPKDDRESNFYYHVTIVPYAIRENSLLNK